MQSGCEIIESYQPGFQVPSPQSLAHGTTKSLQMENSTKDILTNYELVLWILWKIQVTNISTSRMNKVIHKKTSQHPQPYQDDILNGRTEDLRTDSLIKNLEGRKLLCMNLQVSLFSCLALIWFLYIDLILHDFCMALNSYLPFLSLLCIKTMLLCSDI